MTNNKLKIKSYFVAVFSIVVLVILDQWTKLLAVTHLKDQPSIVLINHVFELHYLENHGAAFGMMQNMRFFFLLIGIVILSAIAYLYGRIPFEKKFLVLKVCSVFIGAGAIGNMIDRYSNAYVVDFLYFSLIDFPIFNVADIYVTCATFVLMFLLIFYYKEEDLEKVFHKRG